MLFDAFSAPQKINFSRKRRRQVGVAGTGRLDPQFESTPPVPVTRLCRSKLCANGAENEHKKLYVFATILGRGTASRGARNTNLHHCRASLPPPILQNPGSSSKRKSYTCLKKTNRDVHNFRQFRNFAFGGFGTSYNADVYFMHFLHRILSTHCPPLTASLRRDGPKHAWSRCDPQKVTSTTIVRNRSSCQYPSKPPESLIFITRACEGNPPLLRFRARSEPRHNSLLTPNAEHPGHDTPPPYGGQEDSSPRPPHSDNHP